MNMNKISNYPLRLNLYVFFIHFNKLKCHQTPFNFKHKTQFFHFVLKRTYNLCNKSLKLITTQ